MEVAHRRDQADRAAVAARLGQRGAQLGDGADGPHAALPSGQRRAWRRPARRRGSSSSGARSATAARWRSTVASSPRAIGPVSAAWAPSAAQFSTVARTSGTSAARSQAADALGGRLERDEEVRGDRRGGVVGGAVGVGDLDGRSCRARAASVRGGGAGGVGAAGDAARGAGEVRARGGDGHQRVQRERLGRGRAAGRASWRPSSGRRGGRGRSAAAAVAISASGTARRTTSAVLAVAPRPSGPSTGARRRAAQRQAPFQDGRGRRPHRREGQGSCQMSDPAPRRGDAGRETR